MFAGITSLDPHVVIQNGAPLTPYINSSGTQLNPLIGQLRYDNGIIKVYDGVNWQSITGYPVTVALSPTTTAAVDWAYRKMCEEARLAALAAAHPAVAEAVEKLNKTMDELKVIVALTEKEKNDV